MDVLKNYIRLQNDRHYQCLDLPVKEASLFVVIPCFNEPDLLPTLDSLAACHPPKSAVSVLVVVNDSEDASQEAVGLNSSTLEVIAQWQQQHPDLFFELRRMYAHALPCKWAGVGWARKMGMDEAVRQLAVNGYRDGIIVSFDADSTVLPNYLQAIESAFNENPQFNFFTIHFEHPFENNGLENHLREGIIRYELHMRYYRNALQWCGYPHAIHTVGSSFALKASAYAKQGGMNRRKAGEDFYFLHKLVLLGPYGNIASTTVFPSPRQSDRVPFGTGAALKKWAEGGTGLNVTYCFEAFGILKPFLSGSARWWTIPPTEIETFTGNFHPLLQTFLVQTETIRQLLELRSNCSGSPVFERRFFHLINAFWLLKFINFAHENLFTRSDLQYEAVKLLQHIDIQLQCDDSLENILKIYRNLDQSVDPSHFSEQL